LYYSLPAGFFQTYPESAILVTSKHGQQYQCSYPTHQEQKQQKEEEEKIALETGVVELLKPIASQPCMLKVLYAPRSEVVIHTSGNVGV
jgi:hypothetical protein